MLRRIYDRTMGLTARPDATKWLFVISFLESSFFPIPPHPMLGLMCLAKPEKALRYGIICTIASVLGGLFGYAIGYYLYETVGQAILSALGLSEKFPVAACNLNAYGWQIILAKGATPIPFKLITITAGFIHLNLLTFLWSSTLSRGFQFILVGFLFWKFGAPIKPFIEKYLGLLSAAFLVALVGGFVAFSLFSGHGKSDKCSNATFDSIKIIK